MRNRIFVDCHVFDGGFQGTRTYIKGIYSELIKDAALQFFLGASDIDNLRKEFGDHPNVTYLQYPRGNKVKRLLFDLPKMLQKHKIDIAHFQYRVPPIKVCKYIVTTHDVLFEDFPEYFPKMNRHMSLLTYRFSARAADLVLTVSPYSKREIAQYLGVPDAVITPNGVDPVFFEPYTKSEVKKQVAEQFGLHNYLIYVSRLEPRKKQQLLLKHFIDLKLYESHELVFVGHETFAMPELHKLLEKSTAEIRSKVRFIEHLAFGDMLKLLRASKAFIYPSIAEGFGIPPLEAAAARIPVLCSSETAMADFDFFAENLFNPSKDEEFSNKLKRICELPPNEEHLQKISDQIAARYNWKNAAGILTAALSKI
ncbi:glycosyltransferase family 4 protein [Flavobacterium selenitireducens]|uniref:glycosyltransferase family 4 protein n=1 Tax=Flavobacterium selenitireducens TaxID=2722704 RepID=UPI00168B048D|nr:glycosyltransferase family 1 protein [Flavobacterium selenitireducens]MBD3581589.1 glycosyltransferase family 4 protein [Flavobacterium selenitireducens]